MRLGLLLCVLCVLAGNRAWAELTARTLLWKGAVRTWYEHLPAGYDGSPRPLVVALHGFSDTGNKFAALSEWESVADANGVIVVFPNGGLVIGQDFGWNNFVFDGSAPDDAGFLLALIQQLAAEHKADPDRVFMTGFSNGSGMTNNFAGLHSEAFAGIGAVSGGWLTAFGLPEAAMHPISPLPCWVWGNDGDTFDNGSETMDVEEQQQLQYWMRHNGNNSAARTTTAAPYITSVYPAGKAETRFTRYVNGEHAYHSGTSARLWSEFFAHLSRQTRYTPPVSFADWQSRYFTNDELLAPAISGDAADPDGDGLSNLLEYALVCDPRVGDAKGAAAGIVSAGGNRYLSLSARVQPAAEDLVYSSETCDLATQTWTPSGTRLNDAINVTTGAHVAGWQDTAPISGDRRLMRLRVTRQ